jgi:hypothetical protein
MTDVRRASDGGGDVRSPSATCSDVADRHQRVAAATDAAEARRTDVADRHERVAAATNPTRATVSCRADRPAAVRHDRSAKIAATRRARTAAAPERQRRSIESAGGASRPLA